MAQMQALSNTYLHKHTLGDMLRNTLEIYRRNFGTMVLIQALGFGAPLVAGGAIMWIGHSIFNSSATLVVGVTLSSICLYLSIFAVSAATTVALSEVALGNRPSLTRAYRRVFGATMGKLVATSFLQGLILIFGMILLFVPGIIFWLWYVLVPMVVVLENTWGRAALRRSRELGRGHRTRIFSYYLLFCLCAFTAFAMMSFVLASIFGKYGVIATYLCQVLCFPMFTIPMVLFYYDLRVRKEGYDIGALSEDLRD